MLPEQMHRYIANLPIAPLELLPQAMPEPVTAVDINKLPDGIVTGSSLIQFPPEAAPEVRASVALSLLAAQRVASGDNVIVTPEQWMERQNTVLTNLNWLNEGGSSVKSEFSDLNVAVHEAIIPFLTAAFAPAIAASALILTAVARQNIIRV